MLTGDVIIKKFRAHYYHNVFATGGSLDNCAVGGGNLAASAL